MTRGERIVVLVWSLPDALATPGGSRDPRRLMPTERRLCEPCGGTGRAVDRFRRPIPCPACGGAGSVWVDGYTGERTGAPGSTVALEDAPERRSRVGCSWCQEGARARWDADRGTWVPVESRFEGLPRGTGVRLGERCGACDGTGWRWVSNDLDQGQGGQGGAGERVAYRFPGSYRELSRALDELGRFCKWWRSDLVGCAKRGEWPLRSPFAEKGLRFMDARMPARIVVSGDVLEAWRDRERRADMIRGPRRDARLRELAAVGVPVRELARRSGLSESQVRRIVHVGSAC